MSDSTNKEFSKQTANYTILGKKLSSSSKCSTGTSLLKLAGAQSSVKQAASKSAANGDVQSPVPSTASQVTTTLLESRVYSTPSIGFFDIDSGDKDNPLWAADLVKDLYKYWRSVELPIPNYIEGQSEITARKRAILMAWLIEVKRDSGFEQETLYSVVGIIDRFLGKRTIEENKLQLLGLGALLIGRFATFTMRCLASASNMSINDCFVFHIQRRSMKRLGTSALSSSLIFVQMRTMKNR